VKAGLNIPFSFCLSAALALNFKEQLIRIFANKIAHAGKYVRTDQREITFNNEHK
jgi:hypothetical protein